MDIEGKGNGVAIYTKINNINLLIHTKMIS